MLGLLSLLVPLAEAGKRQLTISSVPPGAVVSQNGVVIGLTPMTLELQAAMFRLPSNGFESGLGDPMTVVLTKDGYDTLTVPLASGPYPWTDAYGNVLKVFYYLPTDYFSFVLTAKPTTPTVTVPFTPGSGSGQTSANAIGGVPLGSRLARSEWKCGREGCRRAYILLGTEGTLIATECGGLVNSVRWETNILAADPSVVNGLAAELTARGDVAVPMTDGRLAGVAAMDVATKLLEAHANKGWTLQNHNEDDLSRQWILLEPASHETRVLSVNRMNLESTALFKVTLFASTAGQCIEGI